MEQARLILEGAIEEADDMRIKEYVCPTCGVAREAEYVVIEFV